MLIHRLEVLAPCGWTRPAVALGNFDGVHRGHARLVAETIATARETGGTAVVVTFDPHPARVLQPERAPSALVTLQQKADLLAALGVDHLVVLPFTRALAARTATEFAQEVLAASLQATSVVVGSDFRFGHGRAGDLGTLAGLGAELGFRVRSVEPVVHDGRPISSTRIRETLAAGEVAACADMLGRRFFVDGRVEAGEGRGRSLGFPTANIATENETLPAPGVYACLLSAAGGAALPAVANLGTRPTFGAGVSRLEVHVLDFAGDLYGQHVRVAFAEHLREERRFDGPASLVQQISRDVAHARQVLADAL